MRIAVRILVIIICTTLFTFCRSEEGKDAPKVKIVARAGDEELDINEYKQGFISNGNPKDSAFLAKRAVDKWATEALFYQEALTKLEKEEIDIDKQVEAYRKSLVNYIYQTKIIEANLDTNVTKPEIEEYYDNNRDNFILKDNILKVNYFKIPLKAPVLEKMKKLVYSTQPKDKEQLVSLCAQYADNYFINDSTWLYLDDIKKEVPKLKDQPDFSINMGRIFEFTDELYYYYLKVKDIKIKNSLSPINFERQNIKNFIINKRKTQLIEQYKMQLLQKAKEDKTFILNP